MAYQRARIPHLAEGIASIGEAIAEWGARGDRDRAANAQRRAIGLLTEQTDPATGETAADKLAGAKNKPLAVLKWMKDNGLDGDDQLPLAGQLLTLLTPPAGEGPHVETLAGDVFARQTGLPNPERFSQFVVKRNAKTGDADWLHKPEPAKPVEARWQHLGNGMLFNPDSRETLSVDEVYQRELASRRAGASSQTVNIAGPDAAKLPESTRAKFSEQRAVFEPIKAGLSRLKGYYETLGDDFWARAGAATGIKGPETVAADALAETLRVQLNVAYGQGAIAEGDYQRALTILPKFSDPRLGKQALVAGIDAVRQIVDDADRANMGRISTVAPESAPTVGASPPSPAAPKPQAKSSAPSIADRFRNAK